MAVRLFEIDADLREVVLNKIWIYQIPEFAAIMKRDKGSKGDYRGDAKKRATRELTYIYYMCDFSSPIRDWKPDEKQKEALYYAELKLDDIDPLVETAMRKYEQLMIESSRALRTLKSVYKGMDAMDDYFDKLDFKTKDKMGKLLNDPTAFAANVTKLNKVYDEIRNFEKRVENDMKQASTGIRGPNSVLGEQEQKERKWSEADISQGSRNASQGTGTAASFSDILKKTQEMARREREQELKETSSTGKSEDELSYTEINEDGSEQYPAGGTNGVS